MAKRTRIKSPATDVEENQPFNTEMSHKDKGSDVLSLKEKRTLCKSMPWQAKRVQAVEEFEPDSEISILKVNESTTNEKEDRSKWQATI